MGGFPATMMVAEEEIPVLVELDDEGWPEENTGALNFYYKEGGAFIEGFYLSKEGLQSASGLLANVGVIDDVDACLVNTTEPVELIFARSIDSAVIFCKEGSRRYILDNESARLLQNNCDERASSES